MVGWGGLQAEDVKSVLCGFAFLPDNVEGPAGTQPFHAKPLPLHSIIRTSAPSTIDEAEGRTFIAMELLEGETLRRRISGKLWKSRRCRSKSRSPMLWTPPTQRASSTATSSLPIFCHRARARQDSDFGLAKVSISPAASP